MQIVNDVWVLGAGKFGLKAVERIKQKHPAVNLTVIDQKSAIPGVKVLTDQMVYVRREGIEFLVEKLEDTGGPDWIIPAIPIHVACEWIKHKLSSLRVVRTIDVPVSLSAVLPNTLRGMRGELYSSITGLLCSDDCNEPNGFCTITKEKRPYRLCNLLSSIELKPYKSVVVRSRQLYAGVGGFRPADLFSALQEVRSSNSPVLLSTSCKCHAVVSALN